MLRKILLLLVTSAFFFLNAPSPITLTIGGGTTGFVTDAEAAWNSIEGFFDDLGRSIRQTTRQITRSTRPKTRSTSSKHRKTPAVSINRSTLAPTEVYRGEQVTLTLRYVIQGAPDGGMRVRERSTLNRDDKELTVLKDETSVKTNGVWENTLSFAVPASAQPGNYSVTLQISGQGKSTSARRSFTVLR
ncbi:MAG: hypothetical protein GXY53_02870 [Desulfobulbus sp.]|nr:hypothetical protein [Desulfobulbus sp.]